MVRRAPLSTALVPRVSFAPAVILVAIFAGSLSFPDRATAQLSPTITWGGAESGSQNLSLQSTKAFTAAGGGYWLTVNTPLKVKVRGVGGGGGGGRGNWNPTAGYGGNGGGGGAFNSDGVIVQLQSGITVNRTGCIGGLIPREDVPYAARR